MSQVKAKRIAPSVVNTPVTVHVQNSKALSQEETERLLTKFIDNEETRSNQNLLNNSNNGNNTGASLSQLKRIQRDLRGLPPLETNVAPATTTSTGPTLGKSAPEKHMKFDEEREDEEQKKEEVEEQEAEEEESIPQEDFNEVEIEDASEEKGISKEERKRLKKERKKAEKRARLDK